MLQKPNTFMVIAAHPDDIEMSCGGTVAKLISEGATGYYLLVTDGECGGRRCGLTKAELAARREEEQRAAATAIGVTQVEFLRKPDGGVKYSEALRGEIVRWIRRWKPDLVFTHDPRTLILPWNEINHVDHRTVGSIVLDAIYPFARGRLLYPKQIEKEGLTPHAVKDVLMWDTDSPNHVENVTDFIDARILAVGCHQSQFPDLAPVGHWLRCHAAKIAEPEKYRYGESFQHIDLRPPF